MPFPRILRLQDDKWNNPEDSIGTFIGYLRGGRYRCWEATGPARESFRELSPDIKDFLETSGIPPSDTVSWSIYMIGHNERNAAPKLLICSTDAKTRKTIRQLIKDSKIMDKYPGIGLGDVSTLPDRPVIRELSREAIEALLPLGCDIDGTVLAEGSEPALGKRIFVVNPHDFSLRPATTGPTILHDGRCYQLTVAHVFRQTMELDQSPDQQVAEDDCDFDGMSDTERDDGSQYDEITSKGSATSGEIDSDKASFEASLDAISFEKHSSSSSERPSRDHLDSGNDPPRSVESSEDNPGFGEIDVSQLQFFGRLALTGGNLLLDYALIETSRMPEDAGKSSMITGSLVSNIGEIESDDISIVAATSPYGTVEGRLTATPAYIRLTGQHTFQEVYPIRLGKPLCDGDCGTAIFGKNDNRFYGHVVAGGPGTSIAYLVPAGEISRDIQARSGFGLIWMLQQEVQQQHSEDDLQLSTGLPPDSTTSEVSSIKNLGTWEPEEPQGDRHLGSIEVQQKPNSQPSQNIFINSRPVPERKTGYHYSGKHEEGKLADSLPSQDWSTISGASSGPQIRSKNTGPTAPSGQQFRWPRTITDASPASGKLPERQNSHSTDSSKYLLPKRMRSGHMSHLSSLTSPAFVHSAGLAAGVSLEASVDTTQRVRRQTHDLSSSLSHSEHSSSSAQRDEVASSLASRPVLPQDFEGACETCIFWLLSPEQFPPTEWQECHSRKEGISHIISHTIAHHGLIRGRDPQFPARKYLASCQSFDPFVKAKGDCVKCSSLSEWNETDFTDFAHHGFVLCLRCWQRFDKKEMQEHLAGPLCDFNPEHSKAKKVWILYTSFCSKTHMPTKPPESMEQQKSPHQRYPRELRKRRQPELEPKGEISPYQKASRKKNSDYKGADVEYM
ncbi:hypothetical protein FPCIR_13518 [Fusarium pseudocircinatum]|uniref:Uncharacterized protein n=1 Tax=Fusarium pseudocircinatum TaxID=56676 RepID=A0A8H5KLT5_9HYPO|nr:hypothetical protein FPCIR_13518 [Fusarium pseudocircinatum]